MSLNIPEFQLPNLIARIGGHLPQWPHGVALCTVLNLLARNETLAPDSVRLLEGRYFSVSVLDTGATIRFTCRNGLFLPVFAKNQASDLSFRANLSAYLQLINRQEDPDTLFFRRRLIVEGDTELGLVAKNMLDAIDWPPRLPQWLRLKGKKTGLPEASG